MQLSSRIKGLEESQTLALNRLAKAMIAEGQSVVNLTAGELDFATPDEAKDAAVKAIRDGLTTYTPTAGYDGLRWAVASKLARENKLVYSSDEVMTTAGAKQGLYELMAVLFDPGDEVLVPTPAWVSYEEQMRVLGIKPVFAPTDKKFHIDVKAMAAAIGPKTRGILLNSPNNPTGAMESAESLRKLAALAVKKKLWVISDEIYERISFGTPHISIASLGDDIKRQTIVVGGASKSLAMTGWRLGYMAGPAHVIKAVTAFQSHASGNPSSISQAAAAAGLEKCAPFVKSMLKELAARRAFLLKAFGGVKALRAHPPEGAFYLFVDVSRVDKDSVAFAQDLLKNAGVAVVPGKYFRHDGWVRLSFATSMANLKSAVKRIADYCK
ncbi:pyridoxal phosphate-dependent aminotransferase [Candidatus Uhrbacteria bacterium]|nr:pyridoxal phosphate-dependent aminotransferase [Candidatus Uhrbacteria bacterium]